MLELAADLGFGADDADDPTEIRVAKTL
jgi:hypothetical protein